MGEIFPELAESMRQMNEIISGKRKPSRVFRVEPPRMVGIGWAYIARRACMGATDATLTFGKVERWTPGSRELLAAFPGLAATHEYWRLFDEAERVLWPTPEPWNDGMSTAIDYGNDCAP